METETGAKWKSKQNMRGYDTFVVKQSGLFRCWLSCLVTGSSFLDRGCGWDKSAGLEGVVLGVVLEGTSDIERAAK